MPIHCSLIFSALGVTSYRTDWLLKIMLILHSEHQVLLDSNRFDRNFPAAAAITSAIDGGNKAVVKVSFEGQLYG